MAERSSRLRDGHRGLRRSHLRGRALVLRGEDFCLQLRDLLLQVARPDAAVSSWSLHSFALGHQLLQGQLLPMERRRSPLDAPRLAGAFARGNLIFARRCRHEERKHSQPFGQLGRLLRVQLEDGVLRVAGEVVLEPAEAARPLHRVLDGAAAAQLLPVRLAVSQPAEDQGRGERLVVRPPQLRPLALPADPQRPGNRLFVELGHRVHPHEDVALARMGADLHGLAAAGGPAQVVVAPRLQLVHHLDVPLR
mmetsp:Transcript_5273/g.13460  ORF Transcript_5273/g.13460 Transcript_5273/m.13460 type:complete len:251 (+) Transcript_5273:1477-2229(+)